MMIKMARPKASSRRGTSRRGQHLTVPTKGHSPKDGYLSDSSLFNCDVRKSSFSYQVSPRVSQAEPLKREVYARRSLREKVSDSAQQAYSEFRKMTNKIHTKTHSNCKRRYKKMSALVRQNSIECGRNLLITS